MKGKPAWNKGLTKDTDPRVMSASIKMPGHKCFIDADAMYEMIQKMMHTKSVNKTHNTSKPEDNLYKELVEMYGEEDVIRQYTCEKYPFHCDFYIKSQDLFIEYNGTWDHGDHPFDATNEQDINQLLKLTQKAMQKGEKSRYWNAIYVWTQRDPMKLQTLRDNDLNFKIIYKNTVITK